MYSYSYY